MRKIKMDEKNNGKKSLYLTGSFNGVEIRANQEEILMWNPKSDEVRIKTENLVKMLKGLEVI